MSVTFNAINTGLRFDASINTANISGQGATVCPRLYFQVNLSITEETGSRPQQNIQAWSFGTLTGEFFLDMEKVADIKTYSLSRTRLGGQVYPTEEHLNIEIPLDARNIELLEQHRAGKSFEAKVRINLQVQIFGANPHTPNFPCGLLETSNVQGEISLVVPDTQWREQVLPGLGYGKVIVVELPAVSLASCANLNHSYKALKNAQKQFALGLYDETAGSCRVALDQFFEQVPKEEGSDKTIPKLRKSWETKLGVSTYQWLDDALSAIKEAANKPHHSPHNHFDRLGAQMLLMITTTLVSYAAQQISGERQA